ncbi:MAG: polysaccharide biosynthesis protein [Candidatus Taylorbacteria bacterium CG11_big_fil_rev_8_21_14_0_20_46_11]|uniref:Polysaccharide biosynthesis protein n=1 Tax=Candidatus Taylorbacteria bacterium CG11_big_fil_rev_8_21_14_0_20_46_11 TaxID=1975025 RepID=A0A2H0KF52_9BACT|nr:MAG: polysaccharide biosynthesis protein [Candidatus Taylorbacteria bacterium CG11_big_fil_rev_8_21_14_0_20_46_11]
MKYPLAKPHIGVEEEKAVCNVLRSGILSMGPRVDEFEKRFATFVGVKHAVAVSSGTAGLHLALLVAGLKPGDEVITSPFSFVASANAILYVGATPVFADIDPRTFNVDPNEIEKKITARTKAILVVHIFGQSSDMDPILALARKHKLKVVEDACESLGATYTRKIGKVKQMVGTFGESGVFAFYPNKQMTTGEGGMIVTHEKKLDTLFRTLRNQGRGTDRKWLSHEQLGYNYRMDEMSAALGITQLRKIRFLIRERQKIAGWYNEFLQEHASTICPLSVVPGNTNTWFVYPVLLPRHVSRDSVMEHMAKRSISTKPYLPSIHLFDFYRKQFGFKKGDFPISEAVSDHVLALPFYIGLARKDAEHIIKTLVRVVSSL